MRFQSAKYQATNSPSKIEGAGGSMILSTIISLLLHRCYVVILPLTPSKLRGGTSFRKIN